MASVTLRHVIYDTNNGIRSATGSIYGVNNGIGNFTGYTLGVR